MRATSAASTAPPAGLGLTDEVLRPAAVAMAFLGAGQPHETIAVPGIALAVDDVLVAVELTTICETDVRAVRGECALAVPVVLGHESVGRVIAIGADGTDAVDGGPLRLGDRVVWSATVSCRSCDRCRAGLTQRCRARAAYGAERIGAHRELTGGFASHVQLRRGTAIARVPEALPAAVLAPASCVAATAWAAVARAARERELDGARVRVRGGGLLGLTAAAIAAEHGALVDLVDDDPLRHALGKRFGASAEHPGRPDVVIDATGCGAASALAEVAIGGVVVLAGGEPAAAPQTLDAVTISRRLVTVAAVDGGSGDELAAAVTFLAGRGRAYPFADAVGAVRPLADLDAALAEAGAPGAPPRVGLIAR